MLEVRVHGAGADVKQLRNLGALESSRDGQRDLALTGAELGDALPGDRRIADLDELEPVIPILISF